MLKVRHQCLCTGGIYPHIDGTFTHCVFLYALVTNILKVQSTRSVITVVINQCPDYRKPEYELQFMAGTTQSVESTG